MAVRVNPLLVRVGPSPMAEIQETARRLRAAGETLVDFSIGDPREPTPPAVRQAFVDAVPEVSRYPTTRGLREIRAAVAGYVARRFGVSVDAETQILPTSGSKEAIFSTALAFVDREAGDAVLWPTPGYPVYERGALLAGAAGRPIRLGEDFVLRSELVPAEAWRGAALVWTCSPHNPAGTVTGGDDLARLLADARRAGALLCADECYIDLYEGDPPVSVLEVAGPGSAGVLSYLSLSKRSGMTGYRSGAIVGDPEAIAALTALRTSTGTAPPEPTQAAAVAAWSDDDHVAERRRIFASKRAVLRRAFDDLGLPVVGSTAGLYVWVRVGDDLVVSRRLLEAGIVVSPGRSFGPGGEGYVRLALVPTLAECEEAAAALSTALGGL